MRDEAHVGFVYAHAEGDGRHHDDAVFALKPRLVQGARVGVHAGVIGERGHALLAEPGRGLLDLAPRQAIDDAGLPICSARRNASSCARAFAFSTMR